jgi:hypothetical protein
MVRHNNQTSGEVNKGLHDATNNQIILTKRFKIIVAAYLQTFRRQTFYYQNTGIAFYSL